MPSSFELFPPIWTLDTMHFMAQGPGKFEFADFAYS